MDNDLDMTTQQLHIALQDGFEGDLVVVIVNDQEVYRQAGVQTDYRISLADSFDVALPELPIVIEVRLPDRQTAEPIELTDPSMTYVAVSFLDNTFHFRFSDRPFGYL